MAFLNVIRSRDRTTRLILAAEKLIFNYYIKMLIYKDSV